VLAAGPRRSEYFVQLFRNDGNFSETQNSTSRIELSEIAAQAFPVLLDFLYAPPHVMKILFITTENATALYSLSKYFDIRPLRLLAKQFWKSDIQVLTLKTYFEHVTILQQPAVLQRVMTAFWERVLKRERERDHA
jgi:BTB/POZ domain